MSSAAFVSDADKKLRWMVRHETRFPGDTKQALRRLADRYQISYSALYTLRYRQPTDILMSVYLSICSAYAAELARQEKAFEHERAIAKAKTGLGAALLRLADTLDGTRSEAVAGEGRR